MLGAQGLWTGRDLYRATPAGHGTSFFPVSSEGPLPFSRLLGYHLSILRPRAGSKLQNKQKEIYEQRSFIEFSINCCECKGHVMFLIDLVIISYFTLC
jgi:hypothetical protein